MSPSFRISVIAPKPLFNLANVRAELESLVQGETVADLTSEFYLSSSTWQPVPKFEKRSLSGGNRIGVEVYTTDKRYVYVSEGVRPHIIRPKNAKILRFQTGYQSKSRVGSKRAYAGGYSGKYVGAFLVHHPGSEARKFDELIAEAYQPIFEANVQAAIDRAMK